MNIEKDPKSLEIKALKAKIAETEALRAIELGSLPEKYDFTSLEEFVAAVTANYKPGKSTAPKTPAKAEAKTEKKKGSRAKITEEIKAQVIELTKAGELTIAEIAKKLGIAGPSVSTIRKGAKLTKEGVGRKPKSAPDTTNEPAA